jgi:hypothetical protein
VPRPRFTPTKAQRHLVRALASVGTSYEAICAFVREDGPPLDRKTLHRYFEADLAIGREWVRAKLVTCVIRNGEKDWRCAIAWLQRFGGPEWKLTSADFEGMRAAAGTSSIRIIGGLPPTLYRDPDDLADPADEAA